MIFEVHSIQSVEAMDPPARPHAIISIRTPKGPTANLRTGLRTLGVLYVAFPDVDRNYLDLPEEDKQYVAEDLFGKKNARVILGFVKKHAPSAELFVVHCEGGLSRSPGVVAALSKIMNGDDDAWFKRRSGPNMLVYSTLLEVAASEPEWHGLWKEAP